MRFRWRKTLRWGPIRLNTHNGRATSWSFTLGRLRWNSRTGWHLDTPGPGSVHIGHPGRTRPRRR